MSFLLGPLLLGPRASRPHQAASSLNVYIEFGNPNEVAFGASGRDARGPSKSGIGKLRMKNFWSQGLEIDE
jgi:hypothetical protein